MNIVVPIKQIPSLVDELELNADGTQLDFDAVDFVLNEFDEHAIEQAVLVKEAGGGTVTVIGLDLVDELDGVLFTALAKGADKGVKIVGDLAPGLDSYTHARLLADAIQGLSPDIILTGVQAADDLDGQIGPMLAARLGLPYVGVVSGVTIAEGKATVHKEYSGGLMAEFEVSLPLVVGVQAATQPPRYAPISKVRQLARTVTLDEIAVDDGRTSDAIRVRQLAKPTAAGRAEMLGADAAEVAAKIIEIIRERGLL